MKKCIELNDESMQSEFLYFRLYKFKLWAKGSCLMIKLTIKGIVLLKNMKNYIEGWEHARWVLIFWIKPNQISNYNGEVCRTIPCI